MTHDLTLGRKETSDASELPRSTRSICPRKTKTQARLVSVQKVSDRHTSKTCVNWMSTHAVFVPTAADNLTFNG